MVPLCSGKEFQSKTSTVPVCFTNGSRHAF
jgi:hypothetical protein